MSTPITHLFNWPTGNNGNDVRECVDDGFIPSRPLRARVAGNAQIIEGNAQIIEGNAQIVTKNAQISAKNAITIHNLKKSYGLKPVLRGLQLTLPINQRLALLGANGAGKTTVLRILAGLAKPDTGTVSIFGLDCRDDAQQIRSLVGLVAHQPYLYEELTALENLLFFARMYNVTHAQKRAHDLLRRVGIEKRAHDRIQALSRGLVQRVAWARALLHSPRLLLLDEPDTGLDQDGTALIDSLLAEHMQQGGSVVFTTHHLERALQLADSVVVLAYGRIAYQAETTNLDLETLRSAYQEALR